jgi:hypothetical protein
MTSSELAMPGETVERSAGVAMWRQIEQILVVEKCRSIRQTLCLTK